MDSAAAWLLAIAAAVLPTVVYVLILWWFDRYEKEPMRLLLAAFLWGAVPAIILSLVAEVVLGASLGNLTEGAAELMSSSLLAPVVEESVKGFALLLLLLLFRRELDNVLDGIIYGATIGFGFAMTENVSYFMRSLRLVGPEGLTLTVLLRSFVFGLNHALFTSVFGLSLGYARGLKQVRLRRLIPPLGFLGAVSLHATHNLFASLSSVTCFSLLVSLVSDWGGLLVIAVVMALAWQQEKRWLSTHLEPEVTSGLISQEDYFMFGSYRRRLAAQWRARSQQDGREARRLRRLAQLATELAFKIEQGDVGVAQSLRGQIAALRKQSAVPSHRRAGDAEKGKQHEHSQ